MAQDSEGTPQWVEHASEHFVFRYQRGSYAEEVVDQLAQRSEAFSVRCAKWLDKALPSSPIRIVIASAASCAVSQRPAVAQDAMLQVSVTPEGGVDGLEESIVAALAEVHAQADLTRGMPVVRAVAQLLLSQVEKPSGDASLHRLAFDRHIVNNVAPNLLGAHSDGGHSGSASTDASFLLFLEEAYGAAKTREFILGAVGRGVAAAASTTLECSLLDLRGDWLIFLRGKYRSGVPLRRLLVRAAVALRPHWVLAAACALLSGIGLAISLLAMPQLTRYLFDRIIASGDLKGMAAWLPVALSAYAVSSLANYLQALAQIRLRTRVEMDIQSAAFKHVQRLSMRYFGSHSVGDLLARITHDCTTLAAQFAETVPATVTGVIQLVGAALVLVSLNWVLGLLVIGVGMPLFAVVFIATSGRLQSASREQQERNAGFTSFVQENLSAQYLVKTLDLQSQAEDAFQRELVGIARVTTQLEKAGASMSSGTNMVGVGIYLATMTVGVYLIASGRMTVGSLVAFISLIGQVLSPIADLSQNGRALQGAVGSMERFDELIAEQPEIEEAPVTCDLAPLQEGIRLEDVTMGYEEGAPILHNLSLDVRAGQRVAIVGPSGAGKSTLLALLLRLADPGEGRVLFDGIDLRSVSTRALHREVAVVPQETILLNATVYENIALGLEEVAEEEDVMNAARQAALHDTVVAIEGGYQAPVGERGGRFSGGQRQRFSIARALMRKPSVLLLDEATSALDPVTESEIMRTLWKVGQDRTTITITHRLSSISGYDQIVVLDQGRVVECGTHEELMARGGLYRRLYDEQMGHLRMGVVDRVGPEQAGLKRIPLFADLPDESLVALASHLTTETFEPGAPIITQGEPGDKFYLISDGQVETLATDEAGTRRLNLLNEGEYFGEIALLSEAPRTATIRATVRTGVYSLRRLDFIALVQSQPHIEETVRKAMAERLGTFSSQVPAES